MAITIDNLEIQIQTDAQKATNGVDNLSASLEKLRVAVGGSSGLASNLTQIANAIKMFNGVGKINLTSKINQLNKLQGLIPTLGGTGATQLANNLRDISGALVTFSAIPKLNVNVSSLAKGINTLNTATASFDAARLEMFRSQMQGIASGLSSLNNVGKTNISSVVNALKKLPEITAALKPEVIEAFSSAIQRLTEIMTPLAQRMDAIARGFNVLPRSIMRSINATNKQAKANLKLHTSFGGLFKNLSRTAARFWTLYYSFSRVVNLFSSWYKESNEYIEAFNLFEVSLGDASDAAMEYAKTVEKAMGIDIAEWITNQGNFMRMATGFGIASDSAELMSQNLTQLAYDMSSFFNVDVQTAMDKLQSGMSGQIKGLKEWGYNLSVAALQETALSLGIEQSVRTMTEAQKAQLRYITLIQKSNGVMGDMAKTITSPSNALRILSAQMTKLERALGNIVSVLVTRFIPWIMAATELMTELAQSLAEAWGFEMPEFPEVDLELGSNVEEEVEDAESALNELKKQLMGFDELNILQNPNDDDSQTPSYDLGIELPEYDFLQGLEGIDLEPFKEDLKKILDYATAIGVAFAGWKIGSSIFNLSKVFSGSKSFADNLALASGSVLAISGAFAEGKGIYEVFTTEGGMNNKSFAEIVGGGGALVSGGALIGKYFGNGLIGSAIASIIAGVPMFITGVYDAIVNGFDWQNGVLIPLGLSLTGTGIGTLIGSSGGPIGALIGFVMGLLVDLGIAFWQYFDEIEAWFKDLPGIVKASLVAVGVVLAVGNPINLLAASIVGIITLIKKWDVISEWFETNITQPISNAWGYISTEAEECWDAIKNAFTELTTWFDANIIQPIINGWEDISAKAEECWTAITEYFAPAKEWFSETFDSISQTVEDVFYDIGVIASGCWEIIKTAWNEGITWLDTEIIQPLKETLSNLWLKFVEGAKEAWSGIKTAWNEGITWLDTEIIQPLKENLSNLWLEFVEGAKEAWSGIKTAFGNIVSFFEERWAKIVAVFAPLGEFFVEIKDAISETLKGWMNSLIKGLNKLFEKSFGGLNTAIGKLRGFKIFDIQPFSELRDISVPVIPMLASGGFPSMGQMFIARERGPELVGRIGNKNAVVNNQQIISGIASAVYSAMMAAHEDGSGSGSSNARIVVQIGEKVVGEAAVRFINGQIVQTGSSPIYT